MPLLVRVRPNPAYLAFLFAMVAAAAYTLYRGGLFIIAAVGVLAFALLLAYPVLASTLFRVPALRVTNEGIAFPLMGPSLPWSEVSDVRWGELPVGTGTRPVVLVVPARPDQVLHQVRPWLRGDVRKRVAQFGTPLVIADTSLDRPIDDIFAAIEYLRPPR
ncbi:hypothetical protein [Hamadaea tsunoensis]|uniref:hypothetical protein n=1 Tax=Hamadaea tsunoensis TaxID=53368 RepID=UPI0004157B6F|nr:hypothetical protein [Hamadaea tsunoensis]